MSSECPLQLRPIRKSDEAFLYRVFVSTRPDIAMLDVPVEEKKRLYRGQFDAQTRHYRMHFTDAAFLLVLVGGERAGRFTVQYAPEEIRVIDIALLPKFRSAGIGTRLLNDILAQSRVSDKPVRLHVEKAGRAITFYEGLGFQKIAEKDYHWFMEYKPQVKARDLIIDSASD